MSKEDILLIAIRTGKVENVQAQIDKGANVNHQDRSKNTPLHEAIQNAPKKEKSYVPIVQALLNAGADVNAKNYGKYTALSMACHNYLTAIIEILLKSGADANSKDEGGFTPLIHFVNSIDNDNGEDAKIIKILITSGADVNVNCNGMCPLVSAVSQNRFSAVVALTESGANINVRHNARIGNRTMFKDCTLLMRCCYDVNNRIAEYLIDMGADVNTKDGDGCTALMFACANNGNATIVQKLLDAGADIFHRPPKRLHKEEYDEGQRYTSYHMVGVDGSALMIAEGRNTDSYKLLAKHEHKFVKTINEVLHRIPEELVLQELSLFLGF